MLAHNLLCEILILLQENSSGRTEWIIDSGCTNHMTGDRNLLMESSLSPSSKKEITFADKVKSKVLGLGRVAISRDQYIDKVMLVESLGYNLMSLSMLCDLDLVVLFRKYGCLVQMVSDNSIVFRGVQKGDLYIVDFSEGPQVATFLLARATECWLWHRRLGHAGMRNLQKLVLKKHVLGIEEIRFTKDRLCGAGKMTKAKHPAKTIMLQLVLLSFFIWTSSALLNTQVSEEIVMVLLLLMTSHVTLGCISSLLSQKPKLSSNASSSASSTTIARRSSTSEATTAPNSRTQAYRNSSMRWASLMSSQPHTLLSKMEWLKERTEPSSRWLERCLLNTTRLSNGGLKKSILPATSSIGCIFISSSRKPHTS